MDLNLSSSFFVVGGAGSGFGKAVSISLLSEGASVLGISRTESKLLEIQRKFPQNFNYLAMDLNDIDEYAKISHMIENKVVSGIFVNSGGPPAMSFLESSLNDWDKAYQSVVRWKIAFVKMFLDQMIVNNYGRIVFLESVTVKQPVQNLVLSNSLRMAVVGAAKTLSEEVAQHNITVNIIGPGYHNTPAINRIFAKKSQVENITFEAAKAEMESSFPVKNLGEASDLAALAVWLLSARSAFMTGQTLLLDGGYSRATL